MLSTSHPHIFLVLESFHRVSIFLCPRTVKCVLGRGVHFIVSPCLSFVAGLTHDFERIVSYMIKVWLSGNTDIAVGIWTAANNFEPLLLCQTTQWGQQSALNAERRQSHGVHYRICASSAFIDCCDKQEVLDGWNNALPSIRRWEPRQRRRCNVDSHHSAS